MHTLHDEKCGDLTIKLVRDDHCDSDPRDWDNLGTMVCWHKRYSLGDWKETKENWPTPDLFNIWAEGTGIIKLPLYLYDHSGITMSTGPFSCPWDSGQVGWIYVTHEQVIKEYGDLSEESQNKARSLMESEVKVYDAHIRGCCFGFKVEDEDGNHIDSCWGYHGYEDIDWNYALEQARESAKHAIEGSLGAGI